MSAAPEPLSTVFDFELPARPYPGLRPFNKDEWPIFFGRERMIDDIIARLIQNRLLVVHGDSGCGKSSLIRAGVQPRLEQLFARGGGRWLTCTAMPGDSPIANLAAALASLPGAPSDPLLVHEFHRVLNRGRLGARPLSDLLRAQHGEQVCILLDQFEELFAHARHHGPQQASILIDLLIGLQRIPDASLRVILTMRSEFLGACAHFEGFAQVVNDTQYLLPRMERADLMRAIQEPAQLYDGEVSPELAERLISDARGAQDQLPLIQHALMRLHHRKRGQEGWRLENSDYPSTGGLATLLSDHADEIHDALEPPPRTGRSVVAELFRALTEINADHQAIRRPRTVEELLAVTGTDEATLHRVLDAFRVEGVTFLRPYGDAPLARDQTIDISHEALIRCWTRIGDEKTGWLTQEFDDGLVWNSLRVQCIAFKEDRANVLSPATTEERKDWLRGRNRAWAERYCGGWDDVQALIAASEQQRAEQLEAIRKAQLAKRLKWSLVVVAVILVASLWGMFSVINDRRIAVAARKKAEIASTEALERTRQMQLDRDSERAKADELQQGINRLLTEVRTLKASGGASATPRQGIDAVAKTAAQLELLNQSDVRVTPRIYIHIADEAQREAAREVELGIEATPLGGTSAIVPGIQVVDRPVKRSVLRCFVAADCQKWGELLVKVVNAQLYSPQVVLDDFSKTYTDTGAIRALHFELYFSPDEIVPRASNRAKGD